MGDRGAAERFRIPRRKHHACESWICIALVNWGPGPYISEKLYFTSKHPAVLFLIQLLFPSLNRPALIIICAPLIEHYKGIGAGQVRKAGDRRR
ncbi:hypothetical protein K438DRAFT_1825843 [Mycena galopus ATCC 62051]|nr:hypothetical protein K438DRAFT_1872767 [Mycena galopus ATCC 62051]KAF8196239.1 hypothetical protein K438DRAFT_1825843 [Mycena galopus ATCC 62051]